MRTRLAVITLLVLLASRDAAGEPAPSIAETKVQTIGERKLCMPDMVQCLTLPPGRFVDEDTWQRIDRETKRLQTAETRLDAENKSLRASAAGWQPGWKTLLSVAVLGAVGGAAAYHYTRE